MQSLIVVNKLHLLGNRLKIIPLDRRAHLSVECEKGRRKQMLTLYAYYPVKN